MSITQTQENNILLFLIEEPGKQITVQTGTTTVKF
jgi:hypothetical protein